MWSQTSRQLCLYLLKENNMYYNTALHISIFLDALAWGQFIPCGRSISCIYNSHFFLNSGFMFPAVSDHIQMKGGMSGQYLERVGNVKKLCGAQVLALDRRMYITWGKYCLLEILKIPVFSVQMEEHALLYVVIVGNNSDCFVCFCFTLVVKVVCKGACNVNQYPNNG